jgi:hypothetical protein
MKMSQYTGTNAQEFIDEARKIIDKAGEHGVSLRLIGALAFNLHCPEYNYIHDKWGRVFTDTDFVSRSEHGSTLIEVYRELGYRDDEMITTLYGSSRMVFDNPETGFHSDIFYDKLDFCHVLPLRDRLDVDDLTIPLAELFLEKMQIVQINEKDIVDTLMLIREHDIGESDAETINGPVIGGFLAGDWGFWRTVTGNMEKLTTVLEQTDLFDSAGKSGIQEKLGAIRGYIDREPKPLSWKLRSKVGDKVKWYKEVDEL